MLDGLGALPGLGTPSLEVACLGSGKDTRCSPPPTLHLNYYRYASETRLVQRVAGYWRSCEKENSEPGSNSVPGMETGKPGGGGGGLGIEAAGQGPLHALLSLLRGLRSADKDGRIIVDPGGADGGSLRFVLVDAGRLFSSVSGTRGGGRPQLALACCHGYLMLRWG